MGTSQKSDAELKKITAWFWDQMYFRFQNEWTNKNGELKTSNSEVARWEKALSGLSHRQIKLGVKRVSERKTDFVPSRIAFTKLAKEVVHAAHSPFPISHRIAKGTQEDRNAASVKGLAEARKLLGMKQRDTK